MNYNKLLVGKRVFITTGAQGIGKDIARLFLEQGAIVCLGARNETKLNNAIKDLNVISNRVEGFIVDLSLKQETELVCEKIINSYGGIDILVNTVGVNHKTPIDNLDDDVMERILETNYYSGLRCARKFIPGMKKQQYGNIINISSIHSVQTMPGYGIYAGSKGAMNATARAMALDYAPYKIRINTICPGLILSDTVKDEINSYTNTNEKEKFLLLLRDMQPLDPGVVEDVSNAALFLASDMSSYITGQTIMLDGGASIKAH